MYKQLWLVIGLVLAGCMPVQPQSDQQLAAREQSELVVLEQVHSAGLAQGPATAGSVEIVGGDEESLRAFLARWFSSPYAGAPDMDTTIYIGELPPDVDLPLPSGSRVLGSVEGYYQQLQVIFESDLAPEKVFAYYDGALGAEWRPVDQGPMGQGFVMADPVGRSYCTEDDRTYLTVAAFPAGDGPTDVRLNLDAAQSQYFCHPPDPGPYADTASQLIPTLRVPAGVEMVGGSGTGSSGMEANTTTSLKTAMTAAALEAHFAAQLMDLGWQLEGQQPLEGYAASVWRLTDANNEAWTGYLIVIEVLKDSDRRYAYLQIEKTP